MLTQFLGAFAKLQKATDSFLPSFLPSAMNSSSPTGRTSMEVYIHVFLENLSAI